MKIILGLTGLMVALALSAQAISITNIIVTGHDDPNGSNVIVTAYVAGATSESRAELFVYSANRLFKQSFLPESAVTSNTWTETRWNPNFTGDYIVKVSAFDPSSEAAEHSVTVTVTRTIYGPFNSVKIESGGAYNPDGPWTNMDVSQVILDLDNSSMTSAITMVGFFCDLQNVNYTITTNMTDEQREKAHIDTSAYQPAGTPFRFDMVLHQRPTSILAMGALKRFVWTPDSTNNPDGRGRLVFDVTSCRPWRSSHTSEVPAYVGFNTVYMTSSNAASLLQGVLMYTSAHCQDVEPFITDDGRVGMHINGHSGTTNYLTVFIPDNQLPNFGVTNVDLATNMLTGYVTHYNTNGTSEGDTTAVETEFTRIIGGTNLLYDYNADGVGDSGYEVNFSFTFHSQVDAQIGPTGLAPIATSLADPAIVDSAGNWYVWFSGSGYRMAGPWNLNVSGTPVAADFDGDHYTDCAIVDSTGAWRVWFTSQGYQMGGPWSLGVAGTPVAADFDGDRYGDPAVVDSSGAWRVWFTSQGYQMGGPWSLGISGTPVAADFDGDGYADPAVVNSSGVWRVWFTSQGYQMGGPWSLGVTGLPVAADYDGDQYADPAFVDSTGAWRVWFTSLGYQMAGPFSLGVLGTPIAADFDGQ